MKTSPTVELNSRTLFSRTRLLTFLQTALDLGETRFARQAALMWLKVYPGDLQVALMQAQALRMEDHLRSALAILVSLQKKDPEWIDTYILLLDIYQETGAEQLESTHAGLVALGGAPQDGIQLPAWSDELRRMRFALAEGKLDQAERLTQPLLALEEPALLVAVSHLMLLKKQAERTHEGYEPILRSLSDHYHQRWPECLQFTLIHAESMMDGGEQEKAVALLHQAAAQDAAGQTAARLWGKGHSYRSMWPEKLSSHLELPVPASLAAAFGWNKLGVVTGLAEILSAENELQPDDSQQTVPGGLAAETRPGSNELQSPSGQPLSCSITREDSPSQTERIEHQEISDAAAEKGVAEKLLATQAEMDRIAQRLNQTDLTRSDGRFPVYVILTTRQGLLLQYGPQGLEAINAELDAMKQAIDRRKNWRACIFFADDPANSIPLGVKPRLYNDAWGLKLALLDLDDCLAKKGEMIGAVLIVGGPQVVPFHRLPNPLDDADPDVQSDNPYGTRDENYFVAEWPVGRLPGEAGSDPAPLIYTLRSAWGNQSINSANEKSRPALWQRLLAWLQARFHFGRSNRAIAPNASLGYTAAIWKQASLSVFEPIGQEESMLVSPPAGIQELHQNGKKSRQLGYFNLHGVIDAADWYGHNDPMQPFPGPDYPVAMRPQDVTNGETAPQVVFSEACYGAHICGKTAQQAMALKFLSAGTQAVIGSTCTSYGSITTPLIAADLLGHTFWSLLAKGIPAGEALRQAKIELINEMHRRQGYLDGEDQKTLISFVYYGDPLARPVSNGKLPKEVLRPLERTAVKTICDRVDHSESHPIPHDTLNTVKRVVQQYLPGMSDADISYGCTHLECNEEHGYCPTRQLGTKTRAWQAPAHQVVVLSKQVQNSAYTHRHYARLTFNQQGKVVKMAVSR